MWSDSRFARRLDHDLSRMMFEKQSLPNDFIIILFLLLQFILTRRRILVRFRDFSEDLYIGYCLVTLSALKHYIEFPSLNTAVVL